MNILVMFVRIVHITGNVVATVHLVVVQRRLLNLVIVVITYVEVAN